ncbi:MAG: TetR/AcrR family transcriptional regulator [Chloroflexi bacterium]|nr:TetR/AcrR family transcriptional regulator [Chloroflexota bacterium]MCC6894991.1 TetR/AcrR family transcriptional regulator [Anaerolineae bacterium]
MMPDESLTVVDSSRSRADAIKNRALLLATAKRLFAEQGVSEVTMSAVADAAGVGKGTLYRHFENKLELSMAMLDEDQRDLQDRTLRQMRDNGPTLETLQWFVREVLLFTKRNGQLLCAGASDNGPAGSLAHPAHWWWRQTLRGMISQINPAQNAEYLADAIFVLLDVHNIYFLQNERGYSLEQITDNMNQMIERMVM